MDRVSVGKLPDASDYQRFNRQVTQHTYGNKEHTITVKPIKWESPYSPDKYRADCSCGQAYYPHETAAGALYTAQQHIQRGVDMNSNDLVEDVKEAVSDLEHAEQDIKGALTRIERVQKWNLDEPVERAAELADIRTQLYLQLRRLHQYTQTVGKQAE